MKGVRQQLQKVKTGTLHSTRSQYYGTDYNIQCPDPWMSSQIGSLRYSTMLLLGEMLKWSVGLGGGLTTLPRWNTILQKCSCARGQLSVLERKRNQPFAASHQAMQCDRAAGYFFWCQESSDVPEFGTVLE